MIGTVTIGGELVTMKATAATPMLFKHIFSDDLIRHLHREEDDAERTEVGLRLAFVMAMQAQHDRQAVKALTGEDLEDWLDGFAYVDLVAALGDVFTLYARQAETTSESKNGQEEQNGS